ncbi:VP2 [Gokushovirus WZ-2015a]|nr:VP2 [Gokushovirus WZ-2015a]
MVWDATIGGAISAGAGLAGGLAASSSSSKAARQNMKDQLAWNYLVSQNQYKWMGKQMDEMGINPILWAASGNSPSSVPSINPQMPDTSGIAAGGSAVGNAVNTALKIYTDTQRIDNENKNTAANVALADAQALKTMKEAHIVGEYGAKQAAATIKQTLATAMRNKNEANSINAGSVIGREAGNALDSIATAIKNRYKAATQNSAGKVSKGYYPQQPRKPDRIWNEKDFWARTI